MGPLRANLLFLLFLQSRGSNSGRGIHFLFIFPLPSLFVLLVVALLPSPSCLPNVSVCCPRGTMEVGQK
jgi:hypothetical protein